MEFRSRITQSAASSEALAPTVSPGYSSIDAALAAIAASQFVDMSSTIADASLRANLWLAGSHLSPDDKTVLEDLYLVLPDDVGAGTPNVPGVTLLKLGTHTAALGTAAVLGGIHNHAKSAAFSSTGVLEAMSGSLITPNVYPSSGTLNGAGLVIPDRLAGLGILRAPYLGTATAVSTRLQTWR